MSVCPGNLPSKGHCQLCLTADTPEIVSQLGQTQRKLVLPRHQSHRRKYFQPHVPIAEAHVN